MPSLAVRRRSKSRENVRTPSANARLKFNTKRLRSPVTSLARETAVVTIEMWDVVAMMTISERLDQVTNETNSENKRRSKKDTSV